MLKSMTEPHFPGALRHGQGPATSASHVCSLATFSILYLFWQSPGWPPLGVLFSQELPMALISGFGCDVSLRDPASHYAESGHLNEVLAILNLLVIR